MLARAPTARGCKVIYLPAMEELAQKFGLLWTETRLQVVHQICMQEAGQSERAASRTRARAWKDWASTTAMVDGARLAHRWIKRVAPWADASVDVNGLAVQPQEKADLVAKDGTFGGSTERVRSFLVVSTMLPSYQLHLLTLRDVCGSFSAYTAAGANCTHLCT